MEPAHRLDEADIRDFLSNDYARLVAATTLVTRDQMAAQDAVAEGLARAWERSDRGEGSSRCHRG
jgi:endonuclease YncB( thermonuclease family)